jgi:hypothetical protein
LQTTVTNAFQGKDPEIVQIMGTEHFLRGVRDRTVAYEAARVYPRTVPEALLAMKDAKALLKSLLGRSSAAAVRQVSFQEEPVYVLQGSSSRLLSPTPSPRKPDVVQRVSVGTQSGSSFTSPRRGFSSTPPRRVQNQGSSQTTPPNSPQRSPGRRSRPTHDRCFNCNQPGHFRSDCPLLTPKAKGQ